MLRDRHELVLYDLHPIESEFCTIQGDIQTGDRLELAAEGCDLIVHTPAWHGIHMKDRTDAEFWRLNVDGTFWMFQAAVQQRVQKVIYLSSIAWNNTYEKYGFTKIVGEQLCEYYWRNHQIRYIALRPGGFTPWTRFVQYGERFFTIGVDRRDVLDGIVLAIGDQTLTNDHFILMQDLPLTDSELGEWAADPGKVLGRHVPGAAELAGKYRIDLSKAPRRHDIERTKRVLKWKPKYNLITFFRELKEWDARGGGA